MLSLDAITRSPTKPLLVLEVNPPRGVDLESVFARFEGKLEGVDFLNVTDSALARMKCAAIPFAILLKARTGKEVMVNFSCRDRNLLAIQADLLGGWALGIRSIVALTGDAMTIGDSPERKGVFEVNSIGLLHAVETLNSGRDLAGNELRGAPSYVPGVVVNPNVKNAAAEIKRLKRKADAGARYALSQPVFDTTIAATFCKAVAEEVGIPMFIGLLPLKSAHSAEIIHKIPGIKMPEAVLADVAGRDDAYVTSYFMNRAHQVAEQARPFVAGFHIISGATPLLALQLAADMAKYIGRCGGSTHEA
jgi:5,10-methylenetetrahydrofolate reductase